MKFIFMTYLDRSGSTFFMETLSSYKGVAAIPEGEFLVNRLLIEQQKINKKDLRLAFKKDKKLKYWKVDHSFFSNLDFQLPPVELFMRILTLYAKKVVDQPEVLLFKAQEIVRIPQPVLQTLSNLHMILYVFLVRDPRAIFYSQSRALYQGKPINTDPVRFSLTWRHYIDHLIRVKKSFRNSIIVKYEELINNLDETVKGVFQKIDVLPEKTMKGNYILQLGDELLKLHKEFRIAPDPSRINKWQDTLNPAEVSLIRIMCKRQMYRMGYRDKRKNEKESIHLMHYFRLLYKGLVARLIR